METKAYRKMLSELARHRATERREAQRAEWADHRPRRVEAKTEEEFLFDSHPND